MNDIEDEPVAIERWEKTIGDQTVATIVYLYKDGPREPGYRRYLTARGWQHVSTQQRASISLDDGTIIGFGADTLME